MFLRDCYIGREGKGRGGVHLLWVVLDGHLGNVMLGIVGERRVLNNSGMWLFALEVEEIF